MTEPVGDPPPVFTSSTGSWAGLRAGPVIRVLGIRYAEAARFGLPEPTSPSGTTVPCLEPAPACPQPPQIGDSLLGAPYRGVRFDEHCQRLSVTLPADADPQSALPVMVWIHGGSYVSGGGDLPIYDPAVLVHEQRVVVVSVTFRLGVLGFLGDGDRVPANLGLLDVIAALAWIRRTIHAFGGDPENVTLFGQSAGADAIAHLMISEGITGLFHRAILQSAPFGIRTGRERMTRLLLRAVGTLNDDASAEQLFQAQSDAYRAVRRFGFRAGMPFGTQYGHRPLPPERAAEGAWRAVASRYDVLIGWTAEETAFFGELLPGLGRVFAVPLVGKGIRTALTRLTTNTIYRNAGRRFAGLLGAAGGTVSRYVLDWRPRGSSSGAAHLTDLPLLFPSEAWTGARLIGATDSTELEALGRPIRAVWAEFARSGAVGRSSPLLRVDPVVRRTGSLRRGSGTGRAPEEPTAVHR